MVSAPTETKSTPVAAITRRRSPVTPPETSSGVRPAARSTLNVAFSAGSFPTGSVNPGALAVLARHDVSAGEPRSKSWDELADDDIHLAITVCDAAAGETCPVWMGTTLRAHWGVPDPAHVQGDADTIKRAFERTFTEMKERIEALLALPLANMKPAELAAALGDIQRRHTRP